MLSIEDALSRILDHLPLLDAERISLDDSIGRVLREDIISDLDLPPFDRARMDGYALRASDTDAATPEKPVILKAIGDAVAGHAFAATLTGGTAVRIMTGASLPNGADSVEKIESIEVRNDGTIAISGPVRPGKYITPIGSEGRQGVCMVPTGSRITPAHSAVLASFGHAHPLVTRKPRVMLISTGSELVEVDVVPGPSQIRNSNTYSLAGYASAAGAQVCGRQIVPDDLTATLNAISGAVEADVVLLSGGVSMGDLDLVRPALVKLGAEILVEQVAMHPGKPTVFARLGDKVIIGLPGNPVSVAVAFHIFARPALLKMQGATEIDLPRYRAVLTRAVKGAPPRRSHQPANLTVAHGRALAEPLKWSGSSDLIAFMHANALIVVPEERSELDKGEIAEVIALPSW